MTYDSVTYESNGIAVSIDYKVTWLFRVKKLCYLDKNLQGEDTSEEIVEIVENL